MHLYIYSRFYIIILWYLFIWGIGIGHSYSPLVIVYSWSCYYLTPFQILFFNTLTFIFYIYPLIYNWSYQKFYIGFLIYSWSYQKLFTTQFQQPVSFLSKFGVLISIILRIMDVMRDVPSIKSSSKSFLIISGFFIL